MMQQNADAARRRMFPCALIFLSLCLPVFLSAQSQPSSAQAERDDASQQQDAQQQDAQQQDSDVSALTLREQIVVSATLQESRVDEVGSSVTVIGAREIDRLKTPTLAELLRTLPGVAVTRGGGPGQVTSVFLRGGGSSQTLVLIDGVRVNSATTGAYDFADLSTDLIERVEILRGPQSTLYGSEAMGGVISVTTRRGHAGRSGGILLEGGEGGRERVRAEILGGAGSFDYAVSVSDQRDESASAASEGRGNREKDAWQNTSASARLGFNLAEEARLDLALRYFDGEAETDGFDFFAGGPVDDLDRIQLREAVSGRVAYRQEIGRWTQNVSLAFQDDELRGEDPGDFFSNFVIESRSIQLSSQSDLRVGENHVLSAGLVFEEREGGSVGSFDESIDITSIFLQEAFSLKETLHVTVGARWDDHSQFGDEVTWRVAASWRVSDGTRLHGSFGTGFRAPTLNDLYFPGFSNPDLLPETNEAFDFGVEQGFLDDRVLIDLTWFSSDSEDLIAFDFATFLPQNIANAESEGLEAVVEIRPTDRWKIVATQTYNRTEDLATGAPLARRPKNQSALKLFFNPWDAFDGVLSWRSVDDRIDSNGAVMDDYEVVDLTLHFRPWKKRGQSVEPWLRVANLFDEDYEEIPGFTSPGRLAAGGLSLRF